MTLLSTMLLLALGCAPKQQPEVHDVSEMDPALRAVPRVEEFQVGPGDRIAISIWRHSDLDMEVNIAPDGTISFPMVGTMEIAGLTYTQIRDELTTAVSTYIQDPQVSVNIVELKSQKVFVIGEVTNPAVLQLSAEMSILEALAMAGGLNQYARTDNILLVRGGLDTPELYTVDVKGFTTRGEVDQLVYLQRGDIVVVPTRTITNAARYFRDVQTIMAPFLAGSAIYRNAVSGGAQGTSSALD